MSGKLFIVSAPSGAGKTTLVHAVLDKMRPQHSIERVITYTSRVVRTGEQAGKDYHFITSQEFEIKIKKDFFLEWSDQYGNYYGSPRSLINELGAGHSRILIIDRPGAERVMEQLQSVVPIWIRPSDLMQLEQRLVERGSNSAEQIRQRLKLAQKELEQEAANPIYKHYVFNNDFSKAVKDLAALILDELGR